VVRAIKMAAMDEDRSTPTLCQQCAALQAELAALRSECAFLREELRSRREAAARFMTALERRCREANEREYDPGTERGRLQ
jgi:hypothetical protein